jgi:hypothetical protein
MRALGWQPRHADLEEIIASAWKAKRSAGLGFGAPKSARA